MARLVAGAPGETPRGRDIMSSFSRRLVRSLLTTAVAAQLSFAAPLLLPDRFPAAAQTQKKNTKAAAAAQNRKLTADELLVQAQRSLALTVAAAKRAPKIKSKAAAPFVKSLDETTKALKTLRTAASSRNAKRFSRALKQAFEAMGRLNATYRLSDLRAKDVRKGVQGVSKSWQAYFARVGGSKAAATPESTRANARRIASLKKSVSTVRDRRSMSPREVRELTLMLEALERAEAANRAAANQWLALLLLDEIFGWYGGYYDYIVIYEPEYAYYYREEYVYWSEVIEYTEVEFVTYYESYSFESYEETFIVEESYYVEFSEDETVLIEEIEEEVETTVEELYQGSESFETLSAETAELEQAVQESSTQAIEDPADIPDPEVDEAAVLDEDAPALEPDELLAVSAAPAEAGGPTDAEGQGADAAGEAGTDDGSGDPSDASEASGEADATDADGEPSEAQDAVGEDPAADDGNLDGSPDESAEDPAAEEPAAEDEGANEGDAGADAGDEQAADEEPAAEEPAEETGDEQDVLDEPEADAPAEDPEPVEEEPVEEEAVVEEEPAAEEPAPDEPVEEEPAYEEPIAEEPVEEEPAYEEPAYEEPVYEEPVYEEPVYEEPGYEEPAEY